MGNRQRRPRKRNPALVPVIVIVTIFIIGISVLTWALLKKSGKTDTNVAQPGTNGAQPGTASSGSQLSAAIAETEKMDRKWRLADLAAARAKANPANNGAPRVLSAARQIPQNFFSEVNGLDTRRDPSQPFTDFEIQRLRNALNSCGPALAEARKIASVPQGQFEITFNFEKPLDTLLEHLNLSRKTAGLLARDADFRAANRDGDGAMQSAYALFTLAHYHDDEPFLICQLVRIAIQMQAFSALERALTCAKVSDDELAKMQRLLEFAAAANPTALSLRGERANAHAMIESKNYQGANLNDADHAWIIRTMNRAIALADKRLPYYSDEWTNMLKDLNNGSETALRVLPALGKVRDAFARDAAGLRTAALAVAAERYRRAKGHWPIELKLLAPDYIKTIPSDPYKGGPILHARVTQGFTVYVQGLAATSSGDFSAIGSRPEDCQGIRLLNPNLRR